MRLTRIATLDRPVAMAVRDGDPALYFAEKGGAVRVVREGGVDPQPVLDLRGQVATGSEQGLLGLVFAPGGRPLMYVNYTDRAGDTHVVEYGISNGRVDPATRREVLAVDQPQANHNGGHLAFGPDGMLWIGLGDGGGQGDPRDNGQSLSTLLGKMLRIDPASPSAGRPYGIPGGNPFVERPGARPEIWALGLRNPWRYSFDRADGHLWIGDVGGRQREEIDVVPSDRGGHNFGWARLEGTRRQSGTPPAGAVAPVIEYPTRQGGNCAVTGGYVYRGRRIPALQGAYLFGDFCAGDLQYVRRGGDGRVSAPRELATEVSSLASFGEDGEGELYVLSLAGPVFRLDPA